MKYEGLTVEELTRRASSATTACLRLWLHDSRRTVQRIARKELRARAV